MRLERRERFRRLALGPSPLPSLGVAAAEKKVANVSNRIMRPGKGVSRGMTRVATAPVRLALPGAALIAAFLLAGPSAAVAAGPPQIAAAWTTEVSAASATFRGEINPEGESTTYRFEYETEAAWQANPPSERFKNAAKAPVSSSCPSSGCAGSGSSLVAVSQHVSALRSATVYRYRLSAANAAEATLETNPAGSLLAFATQGVGAAFSLPDSRAWEMVSPLEKNGGAIQGPEQNHGGGVLQAATQGNSITYSSSSAFGNAPQGAPPASQYISARTEAGWATENITAPTVSGAYGYHPDGVPYQLFSTDLARGVMLNGLRCPEAEPCPRSYSLWEGGLTELAGTSGLRFEGASPDLRHLVFGGEGGLEEWSGEGLTQVSASSGAALAAQSGAISTDGSRVYFSDAGKLYLREGSTTHQVDEAQGGGGKFQTATPSGEVAFFTKEESPGEERLYRYSTATHTAAELGPNEGVAGVLGISSDGLTAYYQTNGNSILLPPTSPGLYRWHEGSGVTEVAPAEAAQESDWPPTTGTARVSASGEELLFLSRESLTGYDNHDATSGQPDSEAFLYDAAANGGAGQLSCLSCNPTGERPLGPSTIPGAYANGTEAALAPGQILVDSYKPHALAANGTRAFFTSADAIAALDTDRAPDAYQWEAQGEGSCAKPGGCVSLISSGQGAEGASFIDASESGADAYFLTSASLNDPEGKAITPEGNVDPGSADLYDARVGGGFPEPKKPIPCESDECSPLPEPPEDPTVGTAVPGPTDPPMSFPKPEKHCPKGTRRVVKHGKVRCVRKHRKRRHR